MRLRLTALAGVLALALPAGALAHRAPAASHGPGHGKAGQQHGQGPTHRHIPTVAIVAQCSVVSVDTTSNTAVVQITRVNHHGAGLVGTRVTVDLSKATISVADVNGDGQLNLADVAAGDHVLIQGRIPLHGSLSGALAATRLVDQTQPAPSSPSTSTTPAATNL